MNREKVLEILVDLINENNSNVYATKLGNKAETDLPICNIWFNTREASDKLYFAIDGNGNKSKFFATGDTFSLDIKDFVYDCQNEAEADRIFEDMVAHRIFLWFYDKADLAISDTCIYFDEAEREEIVNQVVDYFKKWYPARDIVVAKGIDTPNPFQAPYVIVNNNDDHSMYAIISIPYIWKEKGMKKFCNFTNATFQLGYCLEDFEELLERTNFGEETCAETVAKFIISDICRLALDEA